jgi:hypothetical protein
MEEEHGRSSSPLLTADAVAGTAATKNRAAGFTTGSGSSPSQGKGILLAAPPRLPL